MHIIHYLIIRSKGYICCHVTTADKPIKKGDTQKCVETK